MFLKKLRENLRSLFTIFAVLTTVLLWSANSADAQTRGRYLDFTGNGRTDWVTVTPNATATRTWRILGNPANPAPGAAFIRIFDYGFGSDQLVPRDYIGDNKTEVAVYRPGTPGIFYVSQFPTGSAPISLDRAVPFGRTAAGSANDNAQATGDYDNDGKIDYAVARLSSNGVLTYYIMGSATGTLRTVPFGLAPDTDRFSAVNGADFNADGRDELVFLSIDEDDVVTWYAGDSITGAGVISRQWGNFNTDYVITPADYTGDNRADFVAVRATVSPSVWYINNSANNTSTATQFGIGSPTFAGNDLPVRGDYDGDGRHDIAVYRQSNLTYYVLRSSGGIISQQWGAAGDTVLGTIGTF